MRSALALLLLATSLSAQEHFVHAVDASNVTVLHEQTFDLYRPVLNRTVPIVIFVNRLSADFRTWPGYVAWAQFAASNGFAAVVYQAKEDRAQADFDALVQTLQSRAESLGLDATRIVVWSASTNVLLGLPVAMDPNRDYVRAAVVYYGSAPVTSFRRDVPVLLVRSGLDSTSLMQSIDALTARAFTANAPWTNENVAAGMHGFDLFNDNDVSRAVIDRTIAFMQTSVRLSSAYAGLSDAAAAGAAFNSGDWPAAVSGYRRLAGTTPKDPEVHRRLGLALLERKQFADALRELESAYALGRQGIRDTAYPAAKAAAGARNIERTIYWLDMVMNSRFGPPLEELRTNPAFTAVRDEPAFQQLLTKFAPK